jgi:hypothetical protein
MNQTWRQRLRQALILLTLLCSALVIAPDPYRQEDSDRLAAGLAAGEQAAREEGRRRPADALPLLDDGQNQST